MVGMRPQRMDEVESIIDSGMVWRVLQSDSIPYAGDDKDPRPLPQTTLADFKRSFMLNTKTLIETWHAKQACYFGFAVEDYSWNMRDAITIPREHFWWLATRGDSVLISDRFTHHYTGILGLDNEAQEVAFIDGWSQRFFLRPGLNALGIEASDSLRISQEDFLKVIVGLVTLDTPDLFEHYLAQFPEQKKNAELLRRIGLMLLDDGREMFALPAASYLSQAFRTALQDSLDQSQLHEIAADAYLALKIAFYQSWECPLASKVYADELAFILSHCDESNLLPLILAEDSARIAYSAGWAQQFDVAKSFFDDALSKDPQHEYNNFLRASVAFNQKQYTAAIEDLALALAQNEINLQQANERLSQRDHRDFWGIGRDKNAIQLLRKRQIDSLLLRVRARLLLEQFALAEQDCLEILRLDVKHVDALNILSDIKKRAGDFEAALNYVRQAQLNDSDTKRAGYYQAVIEALKNAELVV